MRRHKWRLAVVVTAIATLVVFAGCESAGTGGSSGDGGSDETPTLDPASEMPDTPDELADSDAGSYVQISSTMFSQFAEFMEPPPDAQSVESSRVSAQAIRSETRTWTTNGLTVTWTYEELEDRHQWTVVWDGTYEVDDTEHTYTDWTVMEGHTLKNAYGGAFTIYDDTNPDGSDKAFTWQWCNDEDTGYYVFGVTGDQHFQLATNGSGSEGELDVYTPASGLSCGETKHDNEILRLGWTSGGGRWEDPQNSDNDGSWGTPPSDVEDPLTPDDDA